MNAWLWLALAAGLSVAVAVGLTALGRWRWAAASRVLEQALDGGRTDALQDRPVRYDARELNGLPPPVQRYFRAALQDGQAVIATATIDMAGTFNLSPSGRHWKPFRSRQRVVTRRPGFLWDARISLAPGLAVQVVDSYIAGRGLLHAAVQGLFTVARLQGEGDIARGEFMRYFAEVAWYPTALLPSQGVRWDPVDAHSANATLSDGALTLTLLFRFNDEGLIGSFRAEARGSTVGGALVMAPWEGHWSDYRRCDGMMVPFTGEVAWLRPEGRQSYFVGSVTALRYSYQG